ncbi:MAG TPA: hypothetical protein VJB57_16095 [Dehalococcoidia bacterium]|nr:hypothetical protein [Dehalococcoidia bacterium]
MKKWPVIGLIIAAVAGCFAMLKRKKASSEEQPPETPQDTTTA